MALRRLLLVALLAPALAQAEVQETAAQIEGFVQGRGSRQGVAEAHVTARQGAWEASTDTDAQGYFVLAVPAGEVELRIQAHEHRPFLQRETLQTLQRLRVKYLIERDRKQYETTVVAQRSDATASGVIMDARELDHIAGSMGDPMRSVGALPGVSQPHTLEPLFIVRGASPGNTGFLIDGIRVPLLYHLIVGPSVLHPIFFDQIQFMPGGFPAEYGGYTGGIVNALTKKGPAEQPRFVIDLNLFETGVLFRHDIPGTDLTGTVAARFGYPMLIGSFFVPAYQFGYWDYQARLDGGTPRSGWTFFAFGARDFIDTRKESYPETNPYGPIVLTASQRTDSTPQGPTFGPWTSVFQLQFHRVELRYHHAAGPLQGTYRLIGGYDDSEPSSSVDRPPVRVNNWNIGARAKWALELLAPLQLTFGLDTSFRHTNVNLGPATPPSPDEEPSLVALLFPPRGEALAAGLHAELHWSPRENLQLSLGGRVDLNGDGDATILSTDPRLRVRWGLSNFLTLKAAVGQFHQPQRFFAQAPGLDQASLSFDLIRSLQASAGAELKLSPAFDLSVEGYVSFMENLLFELSTADLSDFEGASLLKPHTGRSYGLEVMVRKRDEEPVFGWLAYTLSRTERAIDGAAWSTYGLDRTHILNLVLGHRFPRSWEVSVRVVAQSGLPDYSNPTERLPGLFRVDFRVDKRVVYNLWFLDFYVDILNATGSAEYVVPTSVGQGFRFVLPTVGFRAVI